MLYTSYFSYWAKKPQNDKLVSIARGNPKWFNGRKCIELAPTWAMIKLKDMSDYTRQYEEILAKLNPQEILEKVGNESILLCWEKPNEFCHRQLVAQWMKKNGILVREINSQPCLL